MEYVENTDTVLFEEMMKKLDLPRPTYQAREARLSGEAKLVTTVTFYTTNPRHHYNYGPICLDSHPMDSLDAANNDAAKGAIRHMEMKEQKILKDYNYDKLHEKKKAEDCHINKIIENNRKTSKIIKEKDEQLTKMKRCWSNFITSVGDTNDKITDIAKAGYTGSTGQLDNDINITLSEIETGTKHLAQLTFESTDLLQQLGKYLNDTDDDSSDYPTPPQSPMEDTDNIYDDTYRLKKYGLCDMDYLRL